MHRFFVQPDQIYGDHLEIRGEDVKHITKVLRIESDELIEVCDGQGTDYHCTIGQVQGDALICIIQNIKQSEGEDSWNITLFQGLPKGHKMDEIIQKCVELGVDRIVPFQSKRTIVDLKGKSEKKISRWQKIAYAAAKQSKRGIIPEVKMVQTLNQCVTQFSEFDFVLVAYENESTQTLKQAMKTHSASNIAIIIGPEGGFDSDEVQQMINVGAQSVSLGKRILRTETAGMAMLAQITYSLE